LVSIDDAPQAWPAARTPAQLERWTHEFPPRDRYCEAGNAPQTHSRWIRILDAKELSKRAERVKYIGAIPHIRAARRSSPGRPAPGAGRAAEVVCARGTLLPDGPGASADLLPPGVLGPMPFTVPPIMKGSDADKFILWGAGAGHGLGLCEAGAVGQASLGRDY